MKNPVSTQPYKGTQDYYPKDLYIRERIFNIWRETALEFGYEEYDTPILEDAQLYKAKSGEELGSTQLYNFIDKGGREVAIRPEMTPSVARLVAGKLMELPKPIRWFSIQKFYRYEKPQRGRTREFFQLNFDIFGVSTIEAEIEVFMYINRVMQKLNAPKDTWKVYVNNRYFTNFVFEELLGLSGELLSKTIKAVDNYKKFEKDAYVEYLQEIGLDAIQIPKLLEILDGDIALVKKYESQSKGSRELLALFERVDQLGLTNFEFKPYIMRGIAYYTGTVIEMFDTGGNKNPRALFGGGRYDDLLDIFNKPKLPAFGIGWGDKTMTDYLETYNLLPEYKPTTQVLVAVRSENDLLESYNVANLLRENGISTLHGVDNLDLRKQLSYASKAGIPYTLIVDGNELILKEMSTSTQDTLNINTVVSAIKARL